MKLIKVMLHFEPQENYSSNHEFFLNPNQIKFIDPEDGNIFLVDNEIQGRTIIQCNVVEYSDYLSLTE
ncbi:hypothetical protein [Acidiluteibacter ferrifornacis]|uniref:Uncharacterized protein n=1 Tax=Acidiluteibacter ferrifornacis TaxID=2692424 RepID=A0A6N9NJI1_9FLAO|nr:hypothetical protein [Acidiluteibacter ferrifornacis]MBR9832969.1 hypothetical protein [bacterium]NBG65350.1 hypothetical protein [Acidiluteibacter ferrifornacis]